MHKQAAERSSSPAPAPANESRSVSPCARCDERGECGGSPGEGRGDDGSDGSGGDGDSEGGGASGRSDGSGGAGGGGKGGEGGEGGGGLGGIEGGGGGGGRGGQATPKSDRHVDVDVIGGNGQRKASVFAPHHAAGLPSTMHCLLVMPHTFGWSLPTSDGMKPLSWLAVTRGEAQSVSMLSANAG